jgi:hypothetical protein
MIVFNPVDVVVLVTIMRDAAITLSVFIGTGCVLKFAIQYGTLKQYFLDLVTEARTWAARLTDNHLKHIQDATEKTADAVAELKSDLRVAATLVAAAKENEMSHHDEMMEGLDNLKSKQNEKS